jgi:hypothetical protein
MSTDILVDPVVTDQIKPNYEPHCAIPHVLSFIPLANQICVSAFILSQKSSIHIISRVLHIGI